MPEVKEVSPEKPPIKELDELQQDFAEFAIDALAEHFGLKPKDFEVFKAGGEETAEPEVNPEDIEKDGKPWQPAQSSSQARYVIQFAGSKEQIKAQKKASKAFKKAKGSISVGENHWQTRIYKSRSLAADSEGKKVPTVDIPKDI